MKDYIALMRPKHYLKNILIFLPVVFSGHIFDMKYFNNALIGFISFCLLASIVYIFNDIIDAPKDRLHEIKKNRPIAANRVSIREAIILILFLSILCFVLVYVFFEFNIFIYLILFSYLFINILYSIKLKQIPIVDISCIVLGFLLRILYGGIVANISISNWLFLTIMMGAFYLALGKRRGELKKGCKSRKVLELYNLDFVDKSMYMCLSVTIVFYALWCNASSNSALVWTVFIIILLCFKYNLNIESDNYGDPVDVIFSDKLLFFLIFLLGSVLVFIIYA